MQDKVGNKLEIGDRVVFNPPKYKGIVFGTILSFAPKMIKLKYDRTGKQSSNETYAEYENVVKVILK